jgi:hypothetical protein
VVKHFAQRRDDRRPHKTCISIGGLRYTLKRSDEAVSPIMCETSTQRRNRVGLAFLDFAARNIEEGGSLTIIARRE